MTDNAHLKLVKSEKAAAQPPAELPEQPDAPKLTPAEQAEAARFLARTTRLAARRAVVYRLIARLQAEAPEPLADAA